MDDVRPAGKPVKGPAGPRMVGGVDRKTMQELEEKGLLTGAGKRMLHAGEGPTGKGSASRAAGAKPGRPIAQGARPTFRPGARVAAAGGRRGAEADADAGTERLHKVMAQAGLASRRHSEELIQAGRVTVNGQVVTQLGTKVVPGKDRIEVDGRPLGKQEDLVYILLNKPKGYVTTLFDPEGRPKVVDLLGDEVGQRVYPVGRLDYDTEGLLLLTNDGDLANAIMHPAREVKKTYIGKVRGVPGPAKLRALETGIELEDGMTAPAEVKLLEAKGPNAATVSIRIHEGRNRQVRRMFEAVGHEVIHLRRTTLGPLSLKNLEVGQWRELTAYEVSDLRKSVGLRPEEKPAGKGRKPGRAVRRGFAPRTSAPAEAAEESAFATPAVRPAAGLPSPAGGPGPVGRPGGAGRPGGPGRPYGAGRPAGGGRPYGGGRPDGEGRGFGGGRPAGGGRPYGGGRPDGEGRSYGGARPGGPGRPDGEGRGFGGGRPAGGGRPYGGGRPDGEGRGFGGGRPAGGGRPYGGGRPDGEGRSYGGARPGGPGRPDGEGRGFGGGRPYGGGRPGGPGRPDGEGRGFGGGRPDGGRPYGGGRPGGPGRPDGEGRGFGGGRPDGGRPYGGARPGGPGRPGAKGGHGGFKPGGRPPKGRG